MREDIKERIELIHRGDMPEGYKKTDKGMIPIDWEAVALGQYVNVFRGASPRPKGDPQYYGGNIPRVLIEDLTRDGKITYPCLDSLTETGAKKSRYLKKGSIIMSCSGTKVGITGFLGIDACIHDGFFGFSEFVNLNEDYLYYVLTYETELLQSSATKGGVFNNLTTDIMKKLRILLPPLYEQINIKKVLEKFDEQIKKQKSLIIEKEKQKKWLKQNLLSGKRRLKEFEDKWKNIKLADIFYEIDERTEENDEYPILTSSRKGMFFQADYFNKQVASQNNTGYKIIREGHFTYRAMSDDGNYTFNVQNLCCKGIVSPAYSVFSINNKKANDYYIYQFLNDYSFTRYLRILQQGGTRQSLNFDKLCNVEVKLPALNEQNAIANILFKANQEIEMLQQQLKLLTLEKKAMMQLLLTGIVRVK